MKNAEEKSTEERNYTYCLADSDITISKGEEEIKNSLVLTRAFIYDTELQRRSDTDRVTKKLEDIDLNAAFGEGIPVELPSPTGEEAQLWAYLPKEFGKMKKEEKFTPKKKFARKRNYEDEMGGAVEWLYNADFEEYWQYTCDYIIYFTWFKLVGDSLDDDTKEEMEKNVKAIKPKPNFAPLIDEHQNDNLDAKYTTLTKNHPEYGKLVENRDELYALHCTLVKDQAEKDFASFKNRSTSTRCKEFFAKIELMGFSAGVSGKDIKEPAGETLSLDTKEKIKPSVSTYITEEQESPKKKGRFPVVYGDDEVFSDIYFGIFDKLGERGKNLLGSRHDKPKTSDSRDSGVDSFVEPTLSSDPVDADRCSFNFDPEAESYLLASNAHNYYKNDAEIRKYFYQRYRLFSKLDEGIIMDREGWFSVTPEKIAAHIADRIVTKKGMLVVDAFAGVGGNSIQFALKGARVIAIDLDPTRLKCAYQNAKVYGVADRIDFICCDFFHFAAKWTEDKDRREQVDAVFLSPPWGGPSYMDKKDFLLDEGLTPDGFDIFYASRAMSPNIAYFLPKNTSVKQLLSLVDSGSRLEIEQSCLNKKIKLITAYYGNLAKPRE